MGRLDASRNSNSIKKIKCQQNNKKAPKAHEIRLKNANIKSLGNKCSR